jgi:multiple sugar transport system permease protein
VTAARHRSLKISNVIRVSSVYILLVIATAVFFLPFFWMALSAFKPTQDIISENPFSVSGLSLENFRSLLSLAPVGTWFMNSLIYAAGSTIGTIVSSTLVGYGFARSKVRGSRVWFVVAMSTLMIPFSATIFPQYAVYLKLHLVDTFAPLILPTFLGVGGATLFIFLMRQFFLGLPRELEDAAYVDGASSLRVFFSIMLPLARPAMVTVAIFQFVFSWNDLFGPLVYLTNSNLYPITLGVATFSSAYGTEIGPLVAMTFLSVLPLVAIFIVFQRYFVRTLATAGLVG